jgi:hypothetical protein
VSLLIHYLDAGVFFGIAAHTPRALVGLLVAPPDWAATVERWFGKLGPVRDENIWSASTKMPRVSEVVWQVLFAILRVSKQLAIYVAPGNQIKPIHCTIVDRGNRSLVGMIDIVGRAVWRRPQLDRLTGRNPPLRRAIGPREPAEIMVERPVLIDDIANVLDAGFQGHFLQIGLGPRTIVGECRGGVREQENSEQIPRP